MTGAVVSRWARRYVVVAVCWLVLWQAGVAIGIPRQTEVTLGLYGFVLGVVFGKAYSLVPTYFDRKLAEPRAAAVQFPLTTAGVACLAADPLEAVPEATGPVGAILWAAGVAVFVATLAWTIRDNPTGRETGTGGPNAHRASVDRVANAFVPVVLAYLLVGSYATLGAQGVVSPPFDGYPPRATHLLGAGTAALLVFALGFRLLPRFLVAEPPAALVYAVLPAGAVAPILLAASLPSGPLFAVGGLLQALAVIGYAIAYLLLFRRSDRRRIAFYGVLAGAIGGVAAVLVGLEFVARGVSPNLLAVHRRLTLLGFLGLTVVGVSFQFYPPNVGEWPGCTDHTAAAVVGLLAGSVALSTVALGASIPVLERIGAALGLAGALGYAYLLGGAFATRR